MPEDRIIGFTGFQPQQQPPEPSQQAPAQGVAAPPQSTGPLVPVKMNKDEARKFKFLLYEEQEAVETAQKANKRRENYCLQLEKKYSLTGHKWKVDFDRNMIVPA